MRPETADLRPERTDLRPERADLRLERAGLSLEKGDYKRADRQTDEQKSPCDLQDFVPFGAADQKEYRLWFLGSDPEGDKLL